MRAGGLASPVSGDGGVVEMNEVYHGKPETPVRLSRGRVPEHTKKGLSGPAGKRVIISLVERSGEVRSFRSLSGQGDSYTDRARKCDQGGAALHG